MVSGALADYLDWLEVDLVGEERCSVSHRGQTTTHTRTVIPSLPAETPAAEVLRLVRGHWRIENRLPSARAVTIGEERRR